MQLDLSHFVNTVLSKVLIISLSVFSGDTA